MPSFHFDAPGLQLFPSISPFAFWLFKPPAQGRLSGGSGEAPLAPMARTKSVLCRGLFLESGEVYASPFFSLAESRHIDDPAFSKRAEFFVGKLKIDLEFAWLRDVPRGIGKYFDAVTFRIVEV